ncbi:protoporphyrinogen oxidase [Nitrospira sp. BLG_2]|uniref:protoporphyrinogen oxidase n=1 Tax=Nitrospira sp. BLG_2 TaxID=3397507 RepID=UPI003B9C49EF
MTRPRTVVIVGGGISGLATAFSLQEKATKAGLSIRCTLLESDTSWGGKIVTHRVGEMVTEAGPDSFLSQKQAGLDLCVKLGLADQLINTNETSKKACVLYKGQLHDLPEGLLSFVPKQLGSFLRSGLLTWTGLARMGLEIAVPPGPATGDESLAGFLRRRFGAQAFERVLEPLMAGIYAGDAEQMSLRAAFPRFFELEQRHGSIVRGMMAAKKAAPSVSTDQPKRTMFVSLKNGLGDLVTALTRRLTQQGVELRMGARVDALRVRSHKLGRWMYDLILQDGSALSADGVVLATPAYVSADLLRPLTPIAGGLLDMISYASTATIAMAFPRTLTSAIEGFGFIVPRTEQRHLIAATWTSLKWPYRAPADHLLVRCYVGGVGRENILQLDDDALTVKARDELAALCGIRVEPSYAEVNRWWKAMPQYTLGHLDRLAQLEAAISRYPGLVLTGAGYRGVGIPDCIRDGAVAAERVVQNLLGDRGTG